MIVGNYQPMKFRLGGLFPACVKTMRDLDLAIQKHFCIDRCRMLSGKYETVKLLKSAYSFFSISPVQKNEAAKSIGHPKVVKLFGNPKSVEPKKQCPTFQISRFISAYFLQINTNGN